MAFSYATKRRDRLQRGVCAQCEAPIESERKGSTRCRPCQDRANKSRYMRRNALPVLRCDWCGRKFVPDVAIQKYCRPPRDCAEHARRLQQTQWSRRLRAGQVIDDDLSADQIEARIERAYAQIQRDRIAGKRPGVEAYALATRSDRVQAAAHFYGGE